MAWNVGNELKAEGDPELLVKFMHDAARKIKGWDPNHLVTTGMISTRHAWMHTSGNEHWQKKLYDVPWLDFVTNHAYHGDDEDATNLDQENDANSREDDSGLAQSLNKPLLIEEAGFKPTESRRNRRRYGTKRAARAARRTAGIRLHAVGLHGRWRQRGWRQRAGHR